jgi:hypothetical protein
MSTATRRALYGKLAGDTTLNGLLGSPATGYSKAIYHQEAPEHAAYPLIVFQKQAGTPSDAFGKPAALDTEVWLVKTVDKSRSADTAEAAHARTISLLNDASLSMSGATLVFLRRESDVEYSEVADGESYKHVGSLFRVVTTT